MSYPIFPYGSRFPLLVHPNAKVLVKEAERRFAQEIQLRSAPAAVDSTSIVNKVFGGKFALIGCQFWPNGIAEEHSLTLLKVMHWFSMLDNMTDDMDGVGNSAWATQTVCAAILEAFFKGSADDVEMLRVVPGDVTPLPLDAAQRRPISLLLEIAVEWWAELRARMPPLQRARFVQAFSDFILVNVRQARFREEGQLPRLDEYMHLRRSAAGISLFQIIAEYDLDIQLDKEALSNPLLRKLQQATGNHICWLNDYYSFPMEFCKGDYLNLLALLHYRNNMTPEPKQELVPFKVATSEAWAMVTAMEQECVELAQKIKQDAVLIDKPGMMSYVDTICSQTAAMWDCSVHSPRYMEGHVRQL
ncbi:hypothetical protein L7F22_064291 [Adiantum nelumboides]|nr:hypothetical protein [Adiantum nelumboides]